MPVADAEFRGMASSYLTLISKELFLSLKPLVEKYAKREDLDDVQRGIIRVLERKLRYFENVPEEVIKQLSALLPWPRWSGGRLRPRTISKPSDPTWRG